MSEREDNYETAGRNARDYTLYQDSASQREGKQENLERKKEEERNMRRFWWGRHEDFWGEL